MPRKDYKVQGDYRAREGMVPAGVATARSPAEADFFFAAVIPDTLEPRRGERE